MCEAPCTGEMCARDGCVHRAVGVCEGLSVCALVVQVHGVKQEQAHVRGCTVQGVSMHEHGCAN